MHRRDFLERRRQQGWSHPSANTNKTATYFDGTKKDPQYLD